MPTPNFGLPLYTLSDTAALDVLLNGQSSALDAALLANMSSYADVDSARVAMTAPKRRKGIKFRSTDTDRDWIFDGANWVANDGGLFLIRPTTVVGATVSADGSILPTVSGASVSVNGVFSPRFRKYRIEFFYGLSANGSVQLRLRNAGTDNNTNQYISVSSEAQGTTASAFTGTTDAMPTNNQVNQNHWGHYELSNPAHSGTSVMKTFETQTFSARGGTPSLAIRNGRLEPTSIDTATFDGFTVFVVGGITTFNAASWIKVYGIA